VDRAREQRVYSPTWRVGKQLPAERRRIRPARFFREHAFFAGEEPVRLAELHGAWLRQLAQVFDLVWATGWGEEAHRHIAPVLGLPQFPAVVFPPPPFDPAEKVPAIAAFVEDRAVAWVDDLITPEAEQWAVARDPPTLLVKADPTIGLTQEIVSCLKEWRLGLS
jgi:hypothetical protein